MIDLIIIIGDLSKLNEKGWETAGGLVFNERNFSGEMAYMEFVATPEEADTVMERRFGEISIGHLRRFYVTKNTLEEDDVVAALDDEGNQICDCWKSELENAYGNESIEDFITRTKAELEKLERR
jgi:hypothetical protein